MVIRTTLRSAERKKLALPAATLKANKTLRYSAELSTFNTASADKKNNLSNTR